MLRSNLPDPELHENCLLQKVRSSFGWRKYGCKGRELGLKNLFGLSVERMGGCEIGTETALKNIFERGGATRQRRSSDVLLNCL